MVRWHSNSYVLACDWLKLAPHDMTFQYDVVFKSRSDRRNLINHRSQTRSEWSLQLRIVTSITLWFTAHVVAHPTFPCAGGEMLAMSQLLQTAASHTNLS